MPRIQTPWIVFKDHEHSTIGFRLVQDICGYGCGYMHFLMDSVPSFYQLLKGDPYSEKKTKTKLRITVVKETIGLVGSAPQTTVEKTGEPKYRAEHGRTENGISGPFSAEPDNPTIAQPQPPIQI